MAFSRLLLLAASISLTSLSSFGQTGDPCPRFNVGSVVSAPADLFSKKGVLTVNFTYQTEVDSNGLTRYCFVTDTGAQSPTLHLNPGDQLVINLTNAIPQTPANSAPMPGMTVGGTGCTPNVSMTAASVNLHYHGTNTPPTCHQDEVITTLINSGSTYSYDVQFPADEPSGLYWYHPHVHGISDPAVLGGASGAIIVEGIQNVNPIVTGLPQRTLIIRDNVVPGNPQGSAPSRDLSLNYVPVPYPSYTPAVITMNPGQKQFWRVLNASADTIIDLEVQYDGAVQTLQVVARDGVATNSQDGSSHGTAINESHLLLPPAGRAEFIVTGPSLSVKSAVLTTLNVYSGPQGFINPARPLASIRATANGSGLATVPAVSGPPTPPRFGGLAAATPTVERTLYFSQGYITVLGQTPEPYNPDNPPAIVTTEGSVEDWTIQNQTQGNHEFHIHQIHYLLLERNGKPVTGGQYLDTIDIPYWTGTGPYPSIKVRMDFRGVTPGDFVYHCHILAHEDSGMMAIIRVMASTAAADSSDRSGSKLARKRAALQEIATPR